MYQQRRNSRSRFNPSHLGIFLGFVLLCTVSGCGGRTGSTPGEAQPVLPQQSAQQEALPAADGGERLKKYLKVLDTASYYDRTLLQSWLGMVDEPSSLPVPLEFVRGGASTLVGSDSDTGQVDPGTLMFVPESDTQSAAIQVELGKNETYQYLLSREPKVGASMLENMRPEVRARLSPERVAEASAAWVGSADQPFLGLPSEAQLVMGIAYAYASIPWEQQRQAYALQKYLGVQVPPQTIDQIQQALGSVAILQTPTGDVIFHFTVDGVENWYRSTSKTTAGGGRSWTVDWARSDVADKDPGRLGFTLGSLRPVALTLSEL